MYRLFVVLLLLSNTFATKITLDTVQVNSLLRADTVYSTKGITGSTINTGIGNFEVGQNLRTTDTVQFSKIGIGTAPNLANTSLRLDNGTYSSIAMQHSSQTRYWIWEDGSGKFNVGGSGVNLPSIGAMQIGGSGNIGVNTTSSASGIRMLIADSLSQQLGLINNGEFGKTWYIGSSKGNWTAGGGKFQIGTSTTATNSYLTIDSTGKTGFKVYAPTRTVEYAGGAKGDSLRLSSYADVDSLKVTKRSVFLKSLNTYGNDLDTLFNSFNGSASNAKQLTITHANGNVNFNNLRGGIRSDNAWGFNTAPSSSYKFAFATGLTGDSARFSNRVMVDSLYSAKGLTGTTINTGNGNFEIGQNLRTTDDVTFDSAYFVKARTPNLNVTSSFVLEDGTIDSASVRSFRSNGGGSVDINGKFTGDSLRLSGYAATDSIYSRAATFIGGGQVTISNTEYNDRGSRLVLAGGDGTNALHSVSQLESYMFGHRIFHGYAFVGTDTGDANEYMRWDASYGQYNITSLRDHLFKKKIYADSSIKADSLYSVKGVSVNEATVRNLTGNQVVYSDANKKLTSIGTTGTGSVVLSANPTLTGKISSDSLRLVYYADIDSLKTRNLSVTSKVAIGTNIPSKYEFQSGPQLVVGDTSQTYSKISIPTKKTGVGYLVFADTTVGIGRYSGGLSYAHSTDMIAMQTRSVDRFKIDSVGQVAIGPSVPTAKLHVSGGLIRGDSLRLANYAAVDSIYTRRVLLNDSVDFQLRINNPGTNGKTWYMGASDGSGWAGGGKFHIGTSNSTASSFVTIDSTGKAGFGTTAPTAKIHVSGGLIQGDSLRLANSIVADTAKFNAIAVGISAATASTGKVIHVHNSTSGFKAGLHLTNATTGSTATDGLHLYVEDKNVKLLNYDNGAMSFATNNTTRMFIDSLGNVGFSNNAPSRSIDYTKGAKGDSLRLSSYAVVDSLQSVKAIKAPRGRFDSVSIGTVQTCACEIVAGSATSAETLYWYKIGRLVTVSVPYIAIYWGGASGTEISVNFTGANKPPDLLIPNQVYRGWGEDNGTDAGMFFRMYSNANVKVTKESGTSFDDGILYVVDNITFTYLAAE
jgi:hypothetical protein